jgi:hypothetical protein
MADTPGIGEYAGNDHETQDAIREHLKANPHLVDSLYRKLAADIDSLPDRAHLITPSAELAQAEIESLARDRTQGHRGYLFASTPQPKGHVETYVITSAGDVIWLNLSGPLWTHPEPANLFIPDPMPFVVSGRGWAGPQADEVSCGPLGLSYLKQYLKDGAHQLNHRTLMVTHRPKGRGSAVRFHLPSPQVLRYSQSGFYAKLLGAMVGGQGDHAEVVHEDKKYQILTLRGMAQAGARIRRPLDIHRMKDSALDEFVRPWMDDFRQAMHERAAMPNLVRFRKGKNSYLTYTGHRLGHKADQLQAVTPSLPSNRGPGSAAGSLKGSSSSGSISSMTTIGSDLDGLPGLERDVSDGSGHLDISSESSSGHLDISSESSGQATPAEAAQEADPAVEEAYKKAEAFISAARWQHDEFVRSYGSVKEVMVSAGSVDVDRLGSLLAREEKQIRDAYGATNWKALDMDYRVDSYASSEIYNERRRTLRWIKGEQRSLGLPSKQSSLERLSRWASKAFSRKGG